MPPVAVPRYETCRNGHRRTAATIWISPSGKRECRRCNRNRTRRYRAYKTAEPPQVYAVVRQIKVSRQLHLHWVIRGGEQFWRVASRNSQLCDQDGRCLRFPVAA